MHFETNSADHVASPALRPKKMGELKSSPISLSMYR